VAGASILMSAHISSQEAEREDRPGSLVSLGSTPQWPNDLSQVPPLPNNATLGTKPLTRSPLGDTHPNHNRR
jgi:hypothetical protein